MVLAAVGAVGWLVIVYPHRPPAGAGGDVLVDLPEGASVGEVADRLAAEGVVDSAFLFAAYLRILGVGDRLRSGPVLVTEGMTPAEVVRQVAEGLGRQRVRVTLPEGWTRFQIAERLEQLGVCQADAFLAETESAALLEAHSVEASSFEGYLFPDTYELREDMPARRVVRRLARTFERRVRPIVDRHEEGLEALQRDLGWSLHEVVVLASIVEKEAGAHAERPTIAGVFLNRLRSDTFRPKRLQADPTVSYGCVVRPDVSDACRAYDGRITRAMLRDADNPYNTYRHELLPPGPIANPGEAALRAVVQPAETEYLFFVSRNDGSHVFSRTYREHVNAVNRFQRSGSSAKPRLPD